MKLDSLSIPEYTTKLLVNIDNANWLRYYLGEYGIYVSDVHPIINSGGPTNRPTIITINYEDEDWIDTLIERLQEEITARRIFKSVVYKTSESKKHKSFIFTCAKNLVHIADGYVIKVTCKDNKDLQKQFLDVIQQVNKEEKTNCKFDYDEYQVEFIIKEYITPDKYTLVTFVEWFDVVDN